MLGLSFSSPSKDTFKEVDTVTFFCKDSVGKNVTFCDISVSLFPFCFVLLWQELFHLFIYFWAGPWQNPALSMPALVYFYFRV